MKNTLEAVSQFVFVVLTFVLILLISLGISLDFSLIKTGAFWVEVLGQFLLVIITFNIMYGVDTEKRMHDKTSRFFHAYATNRLKIQYVEKEKLEDKLEEILEQENQERLVKKCNAKLYKLCTHVKYEDVMNGEIDRIIERYNLSKRKRKKLNRLKHYIYSGKIKVKKLTLPVFMMDKELIVETCEDYDYNTVVMELKRNARKSVSFFICSVISATLIFSFNSINFWTALIKNVTFVFGAISSGITASIKNVKTKTRIYENRNSLLKRRLDISVEYHELH